MTLNHRDHDNERDALLTAYALDQLSGADRASIEASLAGDPAAQAFVDETRRLASVAKEALVSDLAPAPSKALQTELDERLMVQEVLAKPSPQLHRRGWKREIAIGTVAGGLLASLLVPGLWDGVSERVALRGEKASETKRQWQSTTSASTPADRSMPDSFDLSAKTASESRFTDRSDHLYAERTEAADPLATAPMADETSPLDVLSETPAAESYGGKVRSPSTGMGLSGRSETSRSKLSTQAGGEGGQGRRFMFGVGVNSDAGVTGTAPASAATPAPSPANPLPGRYGVVPGQGVAEGDVAQSREGIVVFEDEPAEQKITRRELLERRVEELKQINQRSPGAVPAEEYRREMEQLQQALGAEQYDQIIENVFLPAKDHALSTFSIDVDTASYANTRRFLTGGSLPPPSAVRIEELINYFTYDDPQPEGNGPFSVNMELAECPWTPGHHLLRVGLKGREIAKDKRPNSNLVFLLDVSGSMQTHNKLPLVKQAMQMLTRQLTENDMVTIVVYAGQEGLALDTTSGDQKDKILGAIESLSAGGSTHASAGITLAYDMAQKNFLKDGTNRVILCTDGDFNVGITDDESLVKLITEKAKSNIFLSVLGFGMGNLKDAKMEKLADKGNGNYGYIDTAKEAQKVLVEQMTGSLITIAKDVKIQIEFNPAQVASYRQIGYENRVLAAKDFDDDTKDAGEIGAGHSVTALYEVVLVGHEKAAAAAAKEEGVPLKYQRSVEKPAPEKAADRELTDAAQSGELCTVKLRFKEPTGDKSELMEFPLKQEPKRFGQASENLRFASSVAAFGMLLRGSEHRGGATMSAVEEIATASLGKDPNGYRAEFLELVRKAEQLGK